LAPPRPSSTASHAAAGPPADDVPPRLDAVQQRILDSLRREGIAVLAFSDLFGEELWRAAAAEIEPFAVAVAEETRSTANAPSHKDDVIVRRFAREREGSPVLTLDSPWLRFAASEALLDVVNAYRGRWMKLFYLDHWYTVPFAVAEERVGSQRWHRDPEEEHIVKVFVYFSDVDVDAGPFEYVRGSASGLRYGDLWPWGVPERYPPQEEFERAVPPQDRLALTGSTGTMIVVDTGGFHRGGFARMNPRVLATCSYIDLEADPHPASSFAVKRKRNPKLRRQRSFGVDFAGRKDALPPQVRFALD
jgi:hypothetical protein